jgi:uncharacterized RmlC-like cupin family protein
MPPFSGQVADHEAALGVELQPALIAQGAEDAGHGDAGGGEGTGHLLMGEAKVEAQALVAGLAVVAGDQLQETAHPLLDPAQGHQRKQGLALAVAVADRLQHGDGEAGIGLDLGEGQAEQVAVAEGAGLEGLDTAEGITEGLVGASKTKQQFIAVDRDRPELHHAAHHQPNVVAEQGHLTAGGEMNQAAALIAGFEQMAEGVTVAGFTGGREHHEQVPAMTIKLYGAAPAARPRQGSDLVKAALRGGGNPADPSVAWQRPGPNSSQPRLSGPETTVLQKDPLPNAAGPII